jgi:regulator of protease activity HflC (stomatin/prohibitin superfamily)
MNDNEYDAETLDTLQPQLTQARVPLNEAGDALMARDATGRIPIVVVPHRSGRVNPLLALAGAAASVGGLLATGAGASTLWAGIGIPVGVALIALGVFQAFRVMVPEGANALLLRGGKYYKTLPSGFHLVMPFFPVSHLVTRRVIPFDVPEYRSPTADNVPATVDMLVMFTIVDPYKFVYSISADDFDQVFLAACQDALRQLIRSLPWLQVPDLRHGSTAGLREAVQADVADYGIVVNKVNVTYAAPPADFLKSQEMRQLLALQKAEVEQKEELEVQRVEEEAAAESLRLQRLQERLEQFPKASQWEWETNKLDVARALAGNTRAFVQVGQSTDVARAFVASELFTESEAEAAQRHANKVATE